MTTTFVGDLRLGDGVLGTLVPALPPPPPFLKEREGKGSEWRSASGRRQLQTRAQYHGFLPKPPLSCPVEVEIGESPDDRYIQDTMVTACVT